MSGASTIVKPPPAILKAWAERGYTPAQIEMARFARERLRRYERAAKAFGLRDPKAPRRAVTRPPSPAPDFQREIAMFRACWMVVFIAEAFFSVAAGAWADGEGEAGAEYVKPRPTIRAVQRAVAEAFAIDLDLMLSERRERPIVRPRQAAMFLAAEITRKSLPELGRRFGGRDHTTVLHAIRVVPGFALADEDFAARIAAARRALGVG